MGSIKKHTYVLGTGLSHDASACLLKDGKIAVAIEKERITRNKHDEGNDTEAILYCLEAEGITLEDVDLVVQNANFGFFNHGNHYYYGPRLFGPDVPVPVVTISHHLAHAYYALGVCPFKDTSVLVLDGCGNFYDECMDLNSGIIMPKDIPVELQHLYAEKDSFYSYKDGQLSTVCKDFSQFGMVLKEYPMHPGSTMHSIGGAYAAVSDYCFGNGDDTGKLMGLAPYGKHNVYDLEMFELKDGRVFLKYDWMNHFLTPARSMNDFWNNFQYYADIAYWTQKETERAIRYLVRSRRALSDSDNLAYTGGVALNAVANAILLKDGHFKNIYFTPAAGDNGLAIGCAYYGWLEVLKRERVMHDGSSTFGKTYPAAVVKNEIDQFVLPQPENISLFIETFFEQLPFFCNKSLIDRDDYLIEYRISDVRSFFVSISKKRVFVSNEASRKPDCFVYTDGDTFINGLRDQRYFHASLREGKSFINGDVFYFSKVVQAEELYAHTKALVEKDHSFKKVQYSYTEDVHAAAAKLLADGKVIAWFQDGCEFGPRALGHRSILADPRKKNIQKFINNKVKFREDFRPFAPVVLREYVNEYFQFEGDSPYMILVVPVQQKYKHDIPGVVHADDSCRIQTVTAEKNPGLYKLISEFRSLTNVPVILNTSFNKKGMPIVETPAQALRYFFECALDVLVMGNYIISKEQGTQQPAAAKLAAVAQYQ